MDPKHSHGPDRIDYQELPGDLTEVHASIQREHPEPTAQSTPVPMWLIATCGFAVCWAGLYLGFFNGGLRGDVFNELHTTPALLFPAPTKAGAAGAGAVAETSLAEQGKAVFAQCVACHQAGGTGVPGQFPPLVKSDYVTGSEKRLVAILLKGLSGPFTVNGATYNGAMPPWEAVLNNKKIAAVASYIRSAWGNSAPEISEAKVAAARKEFEAQKAPCTEAQILGIPADATLPDAAGAAAPPSGGAPAASAPPNLEKLMAMGKLQYMSICVACHQPTGMGLAPVFPPLAKSEFAIGDPKRVVAIVLKGVIGPITVEGKPYNGAMPPQEAQLSDDKIAAVVTYVRKSFGNDASPVTPELVAEVRKEQAARTTSWTEADLKAFGAGSAPAAASVPVPAR